MEPEAQPPAALSVVHIRLRLHDIIEFLEQHAGDLPTLPDVADADMALMYLRHLAKHLNSA